MSETTVRTKTNKAAVRKPVILGTNLNTKSSSHARDVINEKMLPKKKCYQRENVIKLIEDCFQNRIPIRGNIINIIS